MNHPVIAVLGHPNKGKSSIVATLSQNDSVVIGERPGTTLSCQSYPLTVDGETLYTLVDTPGFQRARGALQWMKQHNPTAAERPQVVASFVKDEFAQKEFPDECELLSPLASGAGVLYVVDGSVPFGCEYEHEMEILRWSGRPSMALINPIGGELYVDEWKRTLVQYFNIVRVFDALKADFDKRIELLGALTELNEEWQQPLEKARGALLRDRSRRIDEASRIAADGLLEMLTAKESCRITSEEDADLHRPKMEKRYYDALQKIESTIRAEVENVYGLRRLERRESGLDLFETEDLFSERTWKLFGLHPKDLMLLGAIGGSVAGGVIDVAVGGASIMAGALLGGAIGAVTALYTGKSMIHASILSMPLGEKRLVIGPTKNLNFPHIVFNRARLHHALVARRTHAERTVLQIDKSLMNILAPLSDSDLRSLEKAYRRIRGGSTIEGGEKLFKTVRRVFMQDAGHHSTS